MMQSIVEGGAPSAGLPRLSTQSSDAEIDAHVRARDTVIYHTAGHHRNGQGSEF